jgi:hypothetical protein
MFLRYVLISLLFVLFFAFSAPGQAAQPPSTVDDLIQRLGSNDFKDREDGGWKTSSKTAILCSWHSPQVG